MKTTQRQKAFDVYLNGKWIDTVIANGYDAEEMKRSLVDHDGYDFKIVVVERKTKKGN